MKNLYAYFFLIIILISSCTNDPKDLISEDSKGNEVAIRIENKSPFKFKNVLVNTTCEDQNFGTIKAGEFSSYKLFKAAYRYAFIELKIDEDTLTIQPFDYVGENFLKSGKYTYH